MNDVLTILLQVRELIKHGGELVIPSNPNPYELTLRVVWYKDEKYGFEIDFTEIQLRESRRDLLTRFVNDANDFIEATLK